jgi:hypothetical protein
VRDRFRLHFWCNASVIQRLIPVPGTSSTVISSLPFATYGTVDVQVPLPLD